MVANIFGKIFALTGRLNAQGIVSRINRQITRLTKDISRAERQMNSNKRAEINQAKKDFSIFSNSNIMASLASGENFSVLFKNGVLDYNVAREKQALYDQFNQAVQTQRMMAQNDLETTLNMIEEKYERYQELEIEAMKEEQADLQCELETAKANVEMYKGMEETEGKFAQENIQSMFKA